MNKFALARRRCRCRRRRRRRFLLLVPEFRIRRLERVYQQKDCQKIKPPVLLSLSLFAFGKNTAVFAIKPTMPLLHCGTVHL
jgi:hypothetical protein